MTVLCCSYTMLHVLISSFIQQLSFFFSICDVLSVQMHVGMHVCSYMGGTMYMDVCVHVHVCCFLLKQGLWLARGSQILAAPRASASWDHLSVFPTFVLGF